MVRDASVKTLTSKIAWISITHYSRDKECLRAEYWAFGIELHNTRRDEKAWSFSLPTLVCNTIMEMG
jgi:hypothetical protein